MNTQLNAYATKFSSGLVLALLLFSGIFVLLAVVPAVGAVTNGPAKFTNVNVAMAANYGNTAINEFSFNLTNPATNYYPITGFVLNFPADATGMVSVANALEDYFRWRRCRQL